MSMTNYLEAQLLNHALGSGEYAMPAEVFLALFTAAPGESGGGTEVNGGGYARQAVTFVTATVGTTSSDAALAFTMPACTVVAVGLWDAEAAGNLLFYTLLGSSITYQAGDTENVASGNVTVTLD